MITTLLNEIATVDELIRSVWSGTKKPAQMVVADGGSTDGTLDRLAAHLEAHPDLVVLTETGGRSAGRNAAIRAATHPFIVSIDGGCVPRSDWFERLTGPFAWGADLIGGFYEPKGESPLATAIGLTMVYVREEAEGHFVPSARSMAFTRQLWEEEGGFSESLQFGEDTAFVDGLMLKGHRVEFVPEAVVEWIPPSSLARQSMVMFQWGKGDGLAGLRASHYRRILRDFAFTGIAVTVLAILKPILAPVGLFILAPVIAGQTRLKYRHMDGISKWALIPIASLNGLASSLLGFLLGRRIRKRTETS